LNSFKIIVTRPRDQLNQAIKSIQEALIDNEIDLEVLGLPLLEIVSDINESLAKELYQGLLEAQWLSFVSPNAFLTADQLLKTFHYDWPTHLKLALIGGGSEKIILESRFKPSLIIKPANEEQWDSEGLWLQLFAQEKNWDGKKVLIVRGDTGRDWLVSRLESEKAKVQLISIYKRKNLDQNDEYWQNFLKKWESLPKSRVVSESKPLIWVMSSSLACQYLSQTLITLGLKEVILSQSIALATHEKIAQKAKEIGFSKVLNILPGQESISLNIKNLILKKA
jgi:uroporphyrinogen-III synthase